jgi:hypothetical protein
MATVYLARALGPGGFERLAAIKLMHPHLSADEQFVEMFLDEARVAARIRHPHCVPIVELGDDDEQLFMVMDYVEGDTLAAVEGAAAGVGRAIPLEVVLRVILDALAGLDAAHETRGPDGRDLAVVHRDVSPQNILVGLDGSARLTDFGIARAADRIAATRAGTFKGKAPFMAPEQLTDRPFDRRADVFAMGVTLWEAIALRRLFKGRETYEQALRQGPSPYRGLHGFIPEVPASLDAIIARAVAHRPDDRFPTAAAFADALEAELRGAVATPRQVGTFMAAVAAEKVQRERDAVRLAPRPPAGQRPAAFGRRRSGLVDEPGAAAARVFVSRPPALRLTGSPEPANDTGDDDPEVLAALRALVELPVDNDPAELAPIRPSQTTARTRKDVPPPRAAAPGAPPLGPLEAPRHAPFPSLRPPPEATAAPHRRRVAAIAIAIAIVLAIAYGR